MNKKMNIQIPKIDGVRLDDATTYYLQRQLKYVFKTVYELPLRNLKARKLLPVSYDIPSYARSFVYYEMERYGIMKQIENYADDLPFATVTKTEKQGIVKTYGSAYEYTVEDVEIGAKLGTPISTEKATTVRRVWEETLEKVAWTGDKGIVGLFYHPNITIGTATTGNWPSATAQQIYDDLKDAYFTVFNATNGHVVPDTILVPSTRWGELQKVFDTTSNKTVLTVFKENFPDVTVDYIPELANVDPAPGGGGATNGLLVYVKDPEYLKLEIPMEFKQMPPQAKNLAYVVNCYAKTAGVVVKNPLSIAFIKGV